MSENKNYKNAQLFKALSDEKRLSILELLRDGEKCACVLIDYTNIAQSALSYHMKILLESGIVCCRHDGKYCHYSLCKDGALNAIETLRELTSESLDKGRVHNVCTE